MIRRLVPAVLSTLLALACAAKPPDYSLFRAHQPRSILVLPPQNMTVAVEAPYSYLSTVTMPLAELGYYVFPVEVTDVFLKENGLPTPGEMHSVPVQKFGDVFAADAVLYVTIIDWGQKYIVLTSSTVVAAKASLVDTKSGTLLWTGEIHLQQNSGGSGNLVADLIIAVVEQIIDSSTDQAHLLSRPANFQLLGNTMYGLPPGPRHPQFLTDRRGR